MVDVEGVKRALYGQINRALADAYFTLDRAGEPVYLDLDDDAFGVAAAALSMDREELGRQIVASSRLLLTIGRPGRSMLWAFDDMLSGWSRRLSSAAADGGGLVEPPPVLALLAVFTMAAERMGDGELGENAYYPRLYEILDVPAVDHGRFRNAFSGRTEWYWEALGRWLEMQDGTRGLPSAYALSHRYVGLPVSQALVRESERRRFTVMFEEMGLPPGSPVSHVDMEAALDQWISQSPSPASRNLRGLWERGGVRDRVVDIAIVEFRAWDGVARSSRRARAIGGGTAQRSVRLAVQEGSDFFSRRFDFAALIPRDAASDRDYRLVVGDHRFDVPFREIDAGLDAVRLDPAVVDLTSTLSGILAFESGERSVVRYPRRVVPLVKDTALNVYVETDILAAGVDAGILVVDEDGLVAQVNRVLSEVALPGWESVPGGTAGLPNGWVLYRRVQAMRTASGDIPATSPLAVLVTRVNVQMSLTGGFRMPGRVSRWSLLDLPDVTVVAEEDHELILELQTRDLVEQESVSTVIARGAPPMAVRLREHIEVVGDFTLTLSRGKSRLQSLQLRVRSSAEPDPFAPQRFAYLTHADSDPLWPLRARPARGAEPIVDGALSPGPELAAQVDHDVDDADWGHAPLVARERALIRIPPPEATSCVQTGAHRWRYPTFHGETFGRFIVGTCTVCGMTRRDPSAHWDKLLKRREAQRLPLRPLPVSSLGAVSASPTNWRAAVDAIFYLGAGTRADLAVVSRQIDNSALFESHFLRSLEALGVIEVDRDDALGAQSFEAATTSLAELADGSTLLSGYWPEGLIAEAFAAIRAAGTDAQWLNSADAHLGYADLEPGVILHEMGDPEDVVVAREAGVAMMRRLPHIASLIEHLPSERDPLLESGHELFIPSRNQWTSDAHGREPGALRRRSFGPTEYFLRTRADVEAGTVRRTSMDVAKYLAAWQSSVSLVAYDSVTEELRVPMGSPLPGLYERAAVLCSGVLPRLRRETWSLVYTEIPADFVHEMKARLT